METRVLFAAQGARRKVEVTERTFTDGGASGWPKRVERAYSVRGAKVRDGSLYTDSWDADTAIARAVACFRRHNPKARLTVSWCAPCRDRQESWEVHEGRPSWHQQKAGAIGAAVASGFLSRENAEAYARHYQELHPGEPALVLRSSAPCQHKVTA